MIGHRLGLRLFLEGVETPVIGAAMAVAPDTPVACSIQVIATDKVLTLLPRTVVHLFFYDFVEASAVESKEPESVDEFNSLYKLLFMGELQAIAFQKDSGSRSATLQCVDFSNYWDTTYQYNFQGSLFGQNKANFIGANTNLLGGPLGHGVGTFAALLNGKSVNFPELKGLLAGLVRILEAIGGSYYGDTTFKGCNDFTSIAELRLKILQQITAAEKDDSTAKLFARKTFNMWMNRQMGSLGKLVTFRGVIQILQQFVFHNIFPCPVPLYQPLKENAVKKKKTWAADIAKDPRARTFILKVKQLRKYLSSAQQNLGNYPATFTSGGATTHTQTTARKVTTSETVKNLKNDLASCGTLVAGFLYGGTPNIPGLQKEVATIEKSLKTIDQNVGGAHTPLNPENLGNSSKRGNADNAITMAMAACDTILGIKIKHQKDYTLDKLPRVNNQILRPDIWFCSAPRCNVLFPELYQSFQWSRNYLREVSRLELQTTNEILGDDYLFNGFYYAPNVADMRSGKRLSSRSFGRLIMGHELFTGIIPMYEKMTEANIYAMKGRQVTSKGAKVGYAQRAVNHIYFKHRFEGRQMAAEGRFNPWFVPGFPSVLIDRPMTSDNLSISALPVDQMLKAMSITRASGVTPTRAMLLQSLVPTQFFGCCVQLQHSLNQQGGATSYSFAQARIHREDTEFLGVDKTELNKKIGTSKRTSIVAALPDWEPKENGKGPYGGKIVGKPKDVTKQYKGRYIQCIPSMSRGKSKIVYPVDPVFPLRAYQVSEVFTRRAKVKVDFPIEECIRPPWIWDGYNNLKIGETYMQFFGTNSITDVEGFTSDVMGSEIELTENIAALLEMGEGREQGTLIENDPIESFFDRVVKDSEIPGPAKENKPLKRPPGSEPAVDPFKDEQGKKITAAAILTVEKERTIENAVDYLVRVYSFIKHYGMDVGEFIRNYTWRPAATLVEIMGSSDFNIYEVSDGVYETEGEEGFHSRAFGETSDLFGLVDPKVKQIMGLSKEKKHAVAKKMDVRGRRRQAVWDYVNEITSSRALLG